MSVYFSNVRNFAKCRKKNVDRNFWAECDIFMGFERTLKFMCWPWGVIYRLWYDYESFPRFVDDPKRVYIAMKDQKNFDEKKNSSKFLTPIWNFTEIFEEFSSHGDSFYVLITNWNTFLKVFHNLWMMQNMCALIQWT